MTGTNGSSAALSNRTPLMAGNWKMNLDHLAGTQLNLSADRPRATPCTNVVSASVAVLVQAFTDLRSVQTLIEGYKLLLAIGAHTVHDAGAYTGARSRARSGVRTGAALVPSWPQRERRQYHGEDEVVGRKVTAG